jgi:hypothetical protein|tara:strand:- start:8 stop:202 length:195 start_codon:yes stop_codon:yes gene_type:complete
MSEKVVLFTRINKELKEALDVEAKAQCRSSNSLVEVILREKLLGNQSKKAERLENISRLAGHVS